MPRRWATSRWRRSSTTARSTTSSPPSRRVGSTGTRRFRPAPEADEALLALLASPNVASKRWAFEQYDSIVGSRTARRPETADAAVLAIPESRVAIAAAVDGNGRRVACDPYPGTIEAVLECAPNLACVGAEPLGLTNCLNFGNPEKPHVAWQLERAVSGLADACRALGVPVVGGNVSLYNETAEGPIYPTPVVGMVGELPDAERAAGTALSRRRRDRWSARSSPRSTAPSWPGSVASSAPDCRQTTSQRCGRRSSWFATQSATGLPAPPTTSATAGSPARWPRWRSPGEPARASISPTRLARARRPCSERDPGGFLLAGAPASVKELVGRAGAAGVSATLIGVAEGNEVRITTGDTSVVVELDEAARSWRSLTERMDAAPWHERVGASYPPVCGNNSPRGSSSGR